MASTPGRLGVRLGTPIFGASAQPLHRIAARKTNSRFLFVERGLGQGVEFAVS
jgi:hypothetical protein